MYASYTFAFKFITYYMLPMVGISILPYSHITFTHSFCTFLCQWLLRQLRTGRLLAAYWIVNYRYHSY